ncbi:lysylphosphatidylglycerol synthase domain-containing protein [Cupriavidus pauculus]|jgi:putative membrane protein|uniref:lysylphosphatidylglycerol synthase domain-containing protein n=1 Tax=Cupriavidus pauculus TaxID=82633 RepID=UPI0030F83462
MTWKRFALPGALVGLLILTVVVARQALTQVFDILAHAGWPLIWLAPIHAAALWLDARGWRTLLAPADPDARADTNFLLWVAAVREAVSRLLPTAGVGGEIVGIRLALRRVPDGSAVTASVLVEVMVTMFAHYLFALAGSLLLISTIPATGNIVLVTVGLLLSLPVPALFAYALRHGAWFAWLEAAARRMLGEQHRLLSRLDGKRFDWQIRSLCGRGRLLASTLAWQLASLVVGTLEVWWGLPLLGQTVDFGDALAIEALTLAARQIAFFIPAGLGVQEAVLVALGTSLGIDPPTSLALALVKRTRELAFGIPALLSWQWAEWRSIRNA